MRNAIVSVQRKCVCVCVQQDTGGSGDGEGGGGDALLRAGGEARQVETERRSFRDQGVGEKDLEDQSKLYPS